MTGQMEPCRKLFVLLIKVPGNVPEKFETLYSPLIPGLQELSRKEGINICSPPFSDLLQFLVGSYLCDILGPKPREVVVRNIGCGCDDCRLVDKFLTSRATEETFRFIKAHRLHVEEELGSASDLIRFTVFRHSSPHGLVVTKQPALLAASSWKHRVAEAKKLLKSIGDEDVISKLMGRQYSDMVKALEGTQPFIFTAGDAVKFSPRGCHMVKLPYRDG
jgi:hypothetical protein